MKKVQKLINEILGECADGEYIFRGTPEVYSKKRDGISSSLYRWAKKKDKEVLFHKNFSPAHMEEEIVENAKKHFPPHTSNIEILTDLRHYGGKVTLIDFTYNLYVALFFACTGDLNNKKGELVLCNKDERKRIKDIKYDEKHFSTSIGFIEPANTQASKGRIIAQSSIFVYSSKGYLHKDDYKRFEIDKELKLEILEYLRRFHNISQDTIYNDLIGFIANEKNYATSHFEFYRGLAKLKEEKYKEAIEYYDKAIKINPEYTAAYNNRGVAKKALGLHQVAIEDYSEAIRFNPQYTMAYHNRGNAKSALERYQEAIEDYSEAIRFNPQRAKAYNNRGVAKGSLGLYQEAIEDCNEAIRLNPQYAAAYYNRGKAKSALGLHQEALKDRAKAKALREEQRKD